MLKKIEEVLGREACADLKELVSSPYWGPLRNLLNYYIDTLVWDAASRKASPTIADRNANMIARDKLKGIVRWLKKNCEEKKA